MTMITEPTDADRAAAEEQKALGTRLFDAWWRVNHPLDWWAKDRNGTPLPNADRFLVHELCLRAFWAAHVLSDTALAQRDAEAYQRGADDARREAAGIAQGVGTRAYQMRQRPTSKSHHDLIIVQDTADGLSKDILARLGQAVEVPHD